MICRFSARLTAVMLNRSPFHHFNSKQYNNKTCEPAPGLDLCDLNLLLKEKHKKVTKDIAKYSDSDTHICNSLKVILDIRLLQLPPLLSLAFDQSVRRLVHLFLSSRLNSGKKSVPSQSDIKMGPSRRTLSCFNLSIRSLGTIFHLLFAPTQISG